MKVRRALISVSNKVGLFKFVKALDKLGVEIVSTGGTKKFIEGAGVKVKDIADFTGFPEILDGRVKTLHPKVHGGLLAKRNKKKHINEAENHEIEFIDMVVVNLYPFKEKLEQQNISHEELIENIDIGGPSMLRSAAKNYEDVLVVSDPSDYPVVIKELKNNKDVPLDLRAGLAAKVFIETSNYDNLIHAYLAKNNSKLFPLSYQMNLNLLKEFDLRYGENPHQKAAYYLSNDKDTCRDICLEQLGGKELSYNNLLDLESAWYIAKDLDKPSVAIIKHNNPCGVGQGTSLKKAYALALATDPLSAFGGIVASNRTIDAACATEITKIFTECVIAPDFKEDALKILLSKKNLRIIRITSREDKKMILEYKKVFDGFLVQEKDSGISAVQRVVTNTKPDKDTLDALMFAWVVCKHVKSNAIVIANKGQVLGIGAGQMSRVDAVEIAIRKAEKSGFDVKGAVLASDAFFPFKDSIELMSKNGIKAVIQPGGSVKDNEVIDCCNKNKISMVLTGQRHFRH